MRRDLSALTEKEYDLVVVGGGAFGACAAWDAASRGLSVALVERRDFCQATSANHFKMVHGGIRYLQHADLVRIRESSRERSALLRIAPHLVRPLPIVLPTYGHGMQGKELLRAGLWLYDLITFDRNRGLKDPQRQIPRGRLLSRQECLDLFPALEKKGLTGAALFYDGQMYNPPRLALSFLWSAVGAGAQVGNYLEVTRFLRKGDRVGGVEVRDSLTGNRLEVSGKVVLNAAGPWAEPLLRRSLGLWLEPRPTFSRDACFVVGRRVIGEYALGVPGRTSDPDALLSREKRHLFIVPWRDYTLIGVWHVVHRGSPDSFTVTEEELQAFLDEVQEAYPPLALTLEDISLWNAGLVLFGENQPGAANLSYGKRSLLIDHARADRVEGLVTLIGVRATTSRGMAEQAIDLVFQKLGRRAPRSTTAVTPIHGGQIESFEEFMHQAIRHRPPSLSSELMRPLIHNYGSEYRAVLRYLEGVPTWAGTVGASRVLKAEVVHAVREEMAQKLGDVVFRRTELGTGKYPGEVALRTCANLMALELGWGESRIEKELEEVWAIFPRHTRAGSMRKQGDRDIRFA